MGLLISVNGQTTQTTTQSTWMNYTISYENFDVDSCVSTTVEAISTTETTQTTSQSTRMNYTITYEEFDDNSCVSTTVEAISTAQTTTITTTTTSTGAPTTATTSTGAPTTSTTAPTSTTIMMFTTSPTTSTTSRGPNFTPVTTTTIDITTISSLSLVSYANGSIFVAPTCPTQSLGTSCNISSDPCAMTQPCLNSATCHTNASALLGYICACVTGYSGTNCEYDVPSCSNCLNGGKCNSTANETTCTCPTGKLGGHCQYEVDICANITCQNYGVCSSSYGNWSCECINPDFYSGTYCQIKSSSLHVKEIVSRSFACVAIGCISTVIGFIILMDVLKYGFHINPKNKSEEEKAAKKKFNLKKSLHNFVQPSIYRRMTVVLQSMGEDERALLLRWSGNVDLDPDALLHLTDNTS
ncbi:unnamed protein product [Adineta steineri]|uniref:EGF-like domain-containing protein n=2 Tax=Adineta steineri TaxID=433720 RepID=A0A814S627_9BILA|nr:unnamed protein product [Adineta steineri]